MYLLLTCSKYPKDYLFRKASHCNVWCFWSSRLLKLERPVPVLSLSFTSFSDAHLLIMRQTIVSFLLTHVWTYSYSLTDIHFCWKESQIQAAITTPTYPWCCPSKEWSRFYHTRKPIRPWSGYYLRAWHRWRVVFKLGQKRGSTIILAQGMAAKGNGTFPSENPYLWI